MNIKDRKMSQHIAYHLFEFIDTRNLKDFQDAKSAVKGGVVVLPKVNTWRTPVKTMARRLTPRATGHAKNKHP